jgi:hypothetical protein
MSLCGYLKTLQKKFSLMGDEVAIPELIIIFYILLK